MNKSTKTQLKSPSPKIERSLKKFRRSGEQSQMRPSPNRSFNSTSPEPVLGLCYLKKYKHENLEESSEPTNKTSNKHAKIVDEEETMAGFRNTSGLDVDSRVMRRMVKKLQTQNKSLQEKLKGSVDALEVSMKKIIKLKAQISDLSSYKNIINKLEMDKSQLQSQVLHLKQQLKELREQLINSTEEESSTNNQLDVGSHKTLLETSEREIHALKEHIQKLELKLDFQLRKEHTQKWLLKTHLEENLRSVRSELFEIQEDNIKLRKNNEELAYKLNYVLQACRCQDKNRKVDIVMNRKDSILSLSSEG